MKLEGGKLGRYHLLSRIGQGGMGTVYRAWCARLERPVALKVLSPDLERDEKARRALVREAALLARVRHPGVVRVLDVDQANGTTFYVMEVVSDPTLQSMLDAQGSQGGKLPLPVAATVMATLLGAVQAMHEAHVVHRDLKPSNVFVSPGGNARLCDFGLACDVARGADATRSGSTSGTLAYMAPEQLLGDDADARTDIYACGLMLYRMLAGRFPFDLNVSAIARAKLARPELPDLRDANPAVSVEIAQVFRVACHQNPDCRYASAAEMQAALAQAFRAPRPGARVPSRAVTAPRRPVFARLAAVAVGLLAGVTIAFLAGLTPGFAHETEDVPLALADVRNLVK